MEDNRSAGGNLKRTARESEVTRGLVGLLVLERRVSVVEMAWFLGLESLAVRDMVKRQETGTPELVKG